MLQYIIKLKFSPSASPEPHLCWAFTLGQLACGLCFDLPMAVALKSAKKLLKFASNGAFISMRAQSLFSSTLFIIKTVTTFDQKKNSYYLLIYNTCNSEKLSSSSCSIINPSTFLSWVPDHISYLLLCPYRNLPHFFGCLDAIQVPYRL